MFDELGAGGAPSTEGAQEPTLDQQLAELAASLKNEPAQAQTPTPQGDGKPPAPAASPELGAEPKKEGEQAPPADDLETQLGEIDKNVPAEPKPEEKGPQLTEDQKAVLAHIPNAQSAERLVHVANSHQNFSNAFESGNFQAVEEMFTSWNKQAYEAFQEYLYQKHGEQIVDRWVTENDPKGPGAQTSAAVRNLQNQIRDLQNQLQNRGQQEQSAQQQQQAQARLNEYRGHINGLFERIKFSPADRPFVTALINERVYNNPAVKAAINAGNIEAVNKIFTASIREYVNRDKQVQAGTQATLKGQEQKKAPVQGVATGTEERLPDDINQVPKGQEDSWLDQQLAGLAKFVKRK